MKTKRILWWVLCVPLVTVAAGSCENGCDDDADEDDDDDADMPESSITLTPESVTRSVAGTPEERRFTVDAVFETTYTHESTEWWVDFAANPTGIISDAWISTSGEAIHTFDYPRVSFEFDPPGTSEFSVEYECVAVGDTTLTGEMHFWSLDDEPIEGYVGSDTVQVTCEEGQEEECDENHSQLGSAVTVAQLLQISQVAFCGTLLPLQILYILHSMASIGQKPVAHDHTTFIFLWAASQYYTLALLNQMFNQSDFDCGEGDNGYTLCPDTVNDLVEGDYLVIAAIVEEDIPLDDPDNMYQYAFVFDSDGDTGNNYTPLPAYPNDFFSDTDRWYQATYTPGGGWELLVNDATDSVISEIASDARIIVRDNALFLVVPASEFAVAEPAFRITAFRHTGDYGIDPPHDWDGSIWPAVADGLEDFPTTGE